MASTSEPTSVSSNPEHSNNYRPDIDGLRAIAVLAVMLFHFKVFPFSGGFIGVDVFFVISGYLITTIIYNDIEKNRFSYLQFYTRRFLRILPAGLLITAITAIAAFFFLFPNELANVGNAIKKLSYFTSNIFFMKKSSDYWDQSSLALQPLLHTWSLSIEEQFYIALPPLIYISTKILRHLSCKYISINVPLIALSTLLFISFILSVYLVKDSPSVGFYSISSRAWELLVGSVLALGLKPLQENFSIATRNIIGALSLATLLICIFTYDEQMAFPSWNAIVPCLSTALIILAGSSSNGHKSCANKLLGAAPLVYVGLISYSLYLWHWPILVITQSVTWKARGMPPMGATLLIISTTLLAYITWKFVERPFRKYGKTKKSQLATIFAGVLSLIAVYFLGQTAVNIGHHKSKIEQPIPHVLSEILISTQTTPGIKCEGSPDITKILSNGGGCIVGADSSFPPSFALIGDSHARMWTQGIDESAKAHHQKVLISAHSSCIPLLDQVPPARPSCTEITSAKLAHLENSEIRNIVLSGYWIDMARTNSEADALVAAMKKTVEQLQNSKKNVYILLDVPQLPDSRMSMIFALDSQDGLSTGPSYASYTKEQGYLNRAITNLATSKNIKTLKPADVMCDESSCLAAFNGKTFYGDQHHITDEGSVRFNSTFDPLFDKKANPLAP